jgi:hypothetical protein
MLAYALGAALAVTTTFVAYYTQILFAEKPWDEARRRGRRARYVAMIFGVMSLLLFFSGTFFATIPQLGNLVMAKVNDVFAPATNTNAS